LALIIDYLYHVDNPEKCPNLVLPTEFQGLVDMFETAEYLGMDDLKMKLILEGFLQKPEFLKYTNVRRHYLDNISTSDAGDENLQMVFENMPLPLLLFTLTDPALE
jgi:hypothetical protein